MSDKKAGIMDVGHELIVTKNIEIKNRVFVKPVVVLPGVRAKFDRCYFEQTPLRISKDARVACVNCKFGNGFFIAG